MNCPNCRFVNLEDALFCEQCGTPLAKPEPLSSIDGVQSSDQVNCVFCGQTVGGDGFCTECGAQQPPPAHFEQELSAEFALVCDVGVRKSQNQDYGKIWQGTIGGEPVSIVTVSDGVSRSVLPFKASKLACETLVSTFEQSSLSSTDTPSLEAVLKLFKNSFYAARDAVLTMPQEPPSPGYSEAAATFVACVLYANSLICGWAGDSRAYVVRAADGGDVLELLTVDHSVYNINVHVRQMSAQTAASRDDAHQIYSCFGGGGVDGLDYIADGKADIAQALSSSFGFITIGLENVKAIVVCSDGLWNFAHPMESDDSAEMLRLCEFTESVTALTMAKRMVDFANQSGGTDNITAGIVLLQPSDQALTPVA